MARAGAAARFLPVALASRDAAAKVSAVVRLFSSLVVGLGTSAAAWLASDAHAAAGPAAADLSAFVAQFSSRDGISLVSIPAGSFRMGSPADDAAHSDDGRPQTEVVISRAFFLGATEVSQAQWSAVMGTNPSSNRGDSLPVEGVSWDDAMAFCRKLTERERAAGRLPEGWGFTLPTEAQWEYACRAGTTGPYAGDLDAMAWYHSNAENATHAVGTKQANAWGLHDMIGNVAEWCADWHQPKLAGGTVSDPTGPVSGEDRVYRGGTWLDSARFCRSVTRLRESPDHRDDVIGFRVAFTSLR